MKRSVVAGLGLWRCRACRLRQRTCRAAQCRTRRRPMSRSTTGPAFISASTAAAAGAIPTGTASPSATPRRRLHRRHAGYNWQGAGSPWVFGVEGDIDWANFRTHAPAARLICGDQEQLVRHRARPRRLRLRSLPALRHRRRGVRRHRSQPRWSSPASSDTNVGWTRRRGHRRRHRRQLDGQGRIPLCGPRQHRLHAAACGVATNADSTLNIMERA